MRVLTQAFYLAVRRVQQALGHVGQSEKPRHRAASLQADPKTANPREAVPDTDLYGSGSRAVTGPDRERGAWRDIQGSINALVRAAKRIVGKLC